MSDGWWGGACLGGERGGAHSSGVRAILLSVRAA